MRSRYLAWLLIAALLLSHCARATPTPQPTAVPTPEPTPTAAATPTITPTPRPVITPPTPLAGGLTPQWWNDCIFYVMLVRSFYDANGDGNGDLQGLIDKLDYLNDGNPDTDTDLGVNALWLLPVMKSPTYHGYGVSDYYQVEPAYGDNDTFRRLVSEAHKRGIYVIVDMTLNHTSEKHPWFQDAISGPTAEHHNWYIWSDTKPDWLGPNKQTVWYQRGGSYYYAFFGGTLPDLNLRNETVTQQMLDVIDYWLRDMGVDGFRLDAIRHLVEEGQQQQSTPATHQWLKRFYQFYKGVQPNAFAIGEVTGDTAERLPYYDDEVDMCFEFDWASAAVSSLDKGDPAALKAKQTSLQALLSQGQYGTFLALQDSDRIISLLRSSLPKARLAATLLLTSPGVPFLWYGEEIGMRGGKPDIYIRRPMQWANQRGAGFSAGRPWMDVDLNYDVVNVADESVDTNSLLSYYRQLTRLRLSYQALRTGSWQALQSSNDRVYAYLRHADDHDVLVVLNLAAEPITENVLGVEESAIPAGSYALQNLLGIEEVAPLTVEAGGGFKAYAPLATLQPLTGYVLLVR
jgi:alpha-amylase